MILNLNGQEMGNKEKVLFIDYWPECDYLHASGSGLGSSLFKLAALADASRANFEVHLLTSPLKTELLEDAAGIDFIHSHPLSQDYSTFKKIINLGISEDQFPEQLKQLSNCHSFTDFDRESYKSTAHLTFWRKYVASALSYPLPDHKSQIDLCIESEEILNAIDLMPGRYKWVAISYQTISELKEYSLWDQVIALLLESDPEIRIVLLGDKEEEFEASDKVLNIMGKSSIQSLKAIISQINLLVGVDGLASNIAMVFQKPAVILFTMISPEHVIDDLGSDKITALTAGNCPYQFCYKDLVNYRSSGCRYLVENSDKKNPECLNFTPKIIVENILRTLAD